MYVIRGSILQDQGLRHYRYTIHLERSLVELFKLYEELGGPAPHAAALIDERIERCLGDGRAPRPLVQSRLHALRRAKDLHQFLVAEPDLTTVKLRLLEHVLFHRSPEARWAAVRELLLEEIDRICETPLPGIAGNGELFKQQLSLRGGRLGRLLATVALFNFDLCEEEPPPNLTIRFRARRFPEHAWEAPPGNGRDGREGAADWALADWAPQHPLCRWEYLAADLAHALFRQQVPRALPEGRGAEPSGWPGQSAAACRAQPRAAAPGGEGRLYCRMVGRFAEGGDPRQLELFPVSAEALVAEIQRAVHRRHGSDGLKALALLLARLDRTAPGEPATLALEPIAQEAFGESRAPRTRRARLAKVRAVLERLSEVECTRVLEQGGRSLLLSGRLLTVLARSESLAPGRGPAESLPAGAAPQDRLASKAEEACDPRWTVLLDPVFHGPGGATLGEPFRALPAALFSPETKRHPYLLALFCYLRRAWARQDGPEAGDKPGPEPGPEKGVVQCSARRLFQEAGLWLKESSPYRSVELLKRELAHMQEAGWLGRWRLIPAGRRDPLEDQYRLEAPGRTAAQAAQPVRSMATELEAVRTHPGIGRGHRALQEGWT